MISLFNLICIHLLLLTFIFISSFFVFHSYIHNFYTIQLHLSRSQSLPLLFPINRFLLLDEILHYSRFWEIPITSSAPDLGWKSESERSSPDSIIKPRASWLDGWWRDEEVVLSSYFPATWIWVNKQEPEREREREDIWGGTRFSRSLASWQTTSASAKSIRSFGTSERGSLALLHRHKVSGNTVHGFNIIILEQQGKTTGSYSFNGKIRVKVGWFHCFLSQVFMSLAASLWSTLGNSFHSSCIVLYGRYVSKTPTF